MRECLIRFVCVVYGSARIRVFEIKNLFSKLFECRELLLCTSTIMGHMLSKLHAQAPLPPSAPLMNSPVKVCDLFTLTNDLAPETFTGLQVHLLNRFGAPWKTSNILPQSGGNGENHRWSAISILKWRSGSPWLTTGYEVRLPRVGSTSVMTEIDIKTGRWNFETVGQLDNGKMDVFIAGYFSQLKRLSTVRMDVGYRSPSLSLSVNVNHILKETAVQCIKVKTITIIYCLLGYRVRQFWRISINKKI